MKFDVPLVPKLHLGTRLSAQFYCRRKLQARLGVNSLRSAMELPQQVRSQMEFGNEEKLKMIHITNRERHREADQTDEEKFGGKRNHPLEVLCQIDEGAETKALQQKEEQRINGQAGGYRDADEKRHKAQHRQSTFSQHNKPDEKFGDDVHTFRTF